MEERLKLFLAMEGLSPSQFADKLGVQRSGVSHLLSGRNKPSFEFISKMLVAFPKINPDWLIMGTGKAYRDFPAPAGQEAASAAQELQNYPEPAPEYLQESNVSLEENDVNTSEPDLFGMSMRGTSAPVQAPEAPVIQRDAPQTASPAPQPEQLAQMPKAEQVASPKPLKYPAENGVKPLQIAGTAQKRVAQITILYTDGTYEVR